MCSVLLEVLDNVQVVDFTLVEAYTETLEDTTSAVHLMRLASSAVVHDVNGQHTVVGLQVQFVTAVERRLGRGSDHERIVVGRVSTASRVLQRVGAVPSGLKWRRIAVSTVSVRVRGKVG